jgi:hypothetical protein
MLRRRAMRRRDRRHRLHTLALARHQQPGTIIPQRSLAVLVADHTRKKELQIDMARRQVAQIEAMIADLEGMAATL